jgi:hypothetical protein
MKKPPSLPGGFVWHLSQVPRDPLGNAPDDPRVLTDRGLERRNRRIARRTFDPPGRQAGLLSPWWPPSGWRRSPCPRRVCRWQSIGLTPSRGRGILSASSQWFVPMTPRRSTRPAFHRAVPTGRCSGFLQGAWGRLVSRAHPRSRMPLVR